VATKIKLMRIGKMREPHYRIVVADARTKRDGRSIEAIGEYHPKDDPSTIKVDSERVRYWLGVGAQPTESVAAILRVTGDWQQFKGEPAPPPMKVAAPRPDRRAAFEEAAREGLAGSGSGGGDATTPRKRAPRKAEAPTEAPAAAAAEAAPAEAAPATPEA
jgi:small subunit ribosomal protein S16